MTSYVLEKMERLVIDKITTGNPASMHSYTLTKYQ